MNQLERISESTEYIRKKFPKKFKPEIALILEKDFDLLSGFKILGELSIEKVPPSFEGDVKNSGKVLFAKSGGKDILIYHGRYHYFDGVLMRDIGHIIYVLKNLGIKKILSVEEVGQLNPRSDCGEIALIYDHINLMGDNPLIGKNESELGLRFPDMSDAYSKELYQRIYEVMQENVIKINDSVYLGTIGPQSETDAEARFYRDIGADVVGYSIVPENITAVHSGIEFSAIGLITRDLVADRMIEDERSEKQKSKEQKEFLKKAEKKLGKVLKEIIQKI